MPPTWWRGGAPTPAQDDRRRGAGPHRLGRRRRRDQGGGGRDQRPQSHVGRGGDRRRLPRLRRPVGAGLRVLLPRDPAAPSTALLPGAALLAIGLQALHVTVVFYLAGKLSRASEAYGALGVALVALAWLFLIGRLTVAAADLNAALWEQQVMRRPTTSAISGSTRTDRSPYRTTYATSGASTPATRWWSNGTASGCGWRLQEPRIFAF